MTELLSLLVVPVRLRAISYRAAIYEMGRLLKATAVLLLTAILTFLVVVLVVRLHAIGLRATIYGSGGC